MHGGFTHLAQLARAHAVQGLHAMQAMHQPHETALIALQWGMSTLRAYRLGTQGQVLDRRRLPWGIMHLPQPTGEGPAPATAVCGFDLAFEQACGDWLTDNPRIPVIACGMVGSPQGWREAPYLDVPLDLTAIGGHLTPLRTRRGVQLGIVPGLMQRHGLVNAMRGEETQVVGALYGHTDIPPNLIVGLPGPHSRWVRVRDGRVVQFDTFLTGEVYATLRAHSLLGRTMVPADKPDEAAFRLGVEVAASPLAVGGVLSTLYSTRALGLTGMLQPQAQPDYLSGLLIGHEAAAVARIVAERGKPDHYLLCGNEDICRRYAYAMGQMGLGKPERVPDAAVHGLWRLATLAGVLAMH